MPVFGFGVAGIMLVGVDGGGGARAVGGAGEKGLGGNRMLSARAPQEREEVAGVGLVLALRRNRPVHGEPRACRRRRDWAAAIGGLWVGF